MSNFIFCFSRKLRPTGTGKNVEEKIRIFRRYCLFGWGFPLVHGIAAVVLDLSSLSSSLEFLKPNFGFRTCWFYGIYAQEKSSDRPLKIPVLVRSLKSSIVELG